MPDGLYERDALAWAERQADLLRRLAAGERLNAAIDWPNVIDEVQDVGLSELRSCKSLLRQALVHLLKLHAWPDNTAAAHWRRDAVGFIVDARDRFAPLMRQRIVLTEVYRTALVQVRTEADDVGEPRPLPEACPFVLDDLLDPNTDIRALVVKIGSP